MKNVQPAKNYFGVRKIDELENSWEEYVTEKTINTFERNTEKLQPAK